MHRFILAVLVAAAGACLVVPLLTLKARAHTITWPDGQSFTFDGPCCDGTDCEAVPLSAIKEVKGGYQVDYWSHLEATPRHVKGFVKHGDVRIKFNPFADRVMSCSSRYTPPDAPGTSAPRCIYPIQPSM